MTKVGKFTAVWNENTVLIVALMHGHAVPDRRHAVVHWCRREGSALRVEKLRDEAVASDAEVMAWAQDFAGENNIEAIYVCNFDEMVC
jgi:hypothetical protein